MSRNIKKAMRFDRGGVSVGVRLSGLVTRGSGVGLPESAVNLLKKLPQGRTGK